MKLLVEIEFDIEDSPPYQEELIKHIKEDLKYRVETTIRIFERQESISNASIEVKEVE